MRHSLSLGLMAALTLLALALAVAPAGAETVNCTVIGSVPFTISSAGIYCLQNHLNLNTASGTAITINADNVVIDFNGHVLSNNTRTETTARGIFSHDHRDITIKNGTIRTFSLCIELNETFPANDNRTHIVEDMKIENCRAQGMWVVGQSSTVRRNVVRDIGGGSADTSHWGINVVGQGSQVLETLVHHVPPSHSFPAIGILVSDEDITVVNNRVSAIDQGVVFGPFGTSGVYRDNIVTSAGTPYVDNGTGINGGNNFPSP